MTGVDLALIQRGEAAGLPGWLLERLRSGASQGLLRAATRWISDLEAARAHGHELERRLQDMAPEPSLEGEQDTRATQERIRRELGLVAARGLASVDPGGALILLDDTEGPLPQERPPSRARHRLLELATRESGGGAIPALTPEELQALHGTRSAEDALDVIIAAARRVRDLARLARLKLESTGSREP